MHDPISDIRPWRPIKKQIQPGSGNHEGCQINRIWSRVQSDEDKKTRNQTIRTYSHESELFMRKPDHYSHIRNVHK